MLKCLWWDPKTWSVWEEFNNLKKELKVKVIRHLSGLSFSRKQRKPKKQHEDGVLVIGPTQAIVSQAIYTTQSAWIGKDFSIIHGWDCQNKAYETVKYRDKWDQSKCEIIQSKKSPVNMPLILPWHKSFPEATWGKSIPGGLDQRGHGKYLVIIGWGFHGCQWSENNRRSHIPEEVLIAQFTGI